MPSIRDFSGGVVNQELQNKDNGGGVLFDCKNVLSSWNGELRKRAGTYWLESLPEYRRIIPYRMPDGNDIILLIGDGAVYGYQFVDEHKIAPVYTYSGDAPTFPNTGWGSSITNGDYTISLTSGFEQTTWGKAFDIPLRVGSSYYGLGAVWKSYLSPTSTTATVSISSEDPQILKSLNLRWVNTCSGKHLGHYKAWVEPLLYYSDDGDTWTPVRTHMSNPSLGDEDALRTSVYYAGPNRTESVVYYKVTNVEHVEPHKHWKVFCKTRVPNNYVYGSERIDFFVDKVTYVSSETEPFVEENSFFKADLLDNIKYAQNDNLMVLTNGQDAPLKIEYSAGEFAVEAYTYTLPQDQGNPNCVAFYQNRLWFGGFTVFPTRVWGSSFGNFADFTIPTTIVSTSPIYVDAVQIQSIIENFWGGNEALYCVSEDGVSMIDAQGGIVATDQIEFKLRNREPADKMMPTVKDDIMIYLGRNQRKILITDYDFVVQRFKANNISSAYDDFLQSGIRELHYIPNRASLIYGMLNDGKWFAILFDENKNKNSIFPFDTQGKIIDIQPIKYGSVTKLCLFTQRAGQYMLEEKMSQPDQKFMDFMSKEEKEEYTNYIKTDNEGYLDCMLKRTFEEPVSEISDLPYSSNDIVSVIADGSYLGDMQLTPSISTELYAWTHDDESLFTQTSTPTTADGVYNKNQELLADSTITAVGTNSITVHKTGTEDVKYYCWENPQQIDTYSAGHSQSVPGIYIRYPEGDGFSDYISRHYYAWKHGDTIGYHWSVGSEIGTKGGLLLELGDNINKYLPREGRNVILSYVQTISPVRRYTKSATPTVGDTVYDENFDAVGTLTFDADTFNIIVNGTKYVRNEPQDVHHEEIIDITNTYTRNSSEDVAPEHVKLILPAEASNVIMGYKYDSYAVIKFVSPYNLLKFPKEISVNFINSGYLEVGNTFDSLKSVLNNLAETATIDNKQILMNGNYTKTLDKQTFETPYVIVRSDKGLPFIITGIDYKVDMSNYQGGI